MARKPKIDTTGVTLEQANAVVLAHREAEYAEKAAEARKHIGKFFKYRNSYGSDTPKWWLYLAVTGADGMGHVKGTTFQRASDGHVDIRREKFLYIHSYTEISAAEFRKAAAKVRAEALSLLTF